MKNNNIISTYQFVNQEYITHPFSQIHSLRKATRIPAGSPLNV